jgi:hypothetical protein
MYYICVCVYLYTYIYIYIYIYILVYIEFVFSLIITCMYHTVYVTFVLAFDFEGIMLVPNKLFCLCFCGFKCAWYMYMYELSDGHSTVIDVSLRWATK